MRTALLLAPVMALAQLCGCGGEGAQTVSAPVTSRPAMPSSIAPPRGPMTPANAANQGYLADFERLKDVQILEDEADRLQGIGLADEKDPMKQRALRKDTLHGWLALFGAIDAALDPRFDPKDLPQVRVSPPVSEGIHYPPGVDPSVLKDPAARAEYQRKIAENERKTANYSLQFKLRRLDEGLMPQAEAFIEGAYSTDPEDRRELEETIAAAKLDPRRAATLRSWADQ